MKSEKSIIKRVLAIGTRPERAWDPTNRIGLGFVCIAMILGSGLIFDRFFMAIAEVKSHSTVIPSQMIVGANLQSQITISDRF